jgi:hypothetical protein
VNPLGPLVGSCRQGDAAHLLHQGQFMHRRTRAARPPVPRAAGPRWQG